MFKLITILFFFLSISLLQAQTYLIDQTPSSVTTCSGTFYDSGGSSSDYGNSESSTFTICPSTPGNYIEVDFTSFNTEASYDELEIFDGNSSAATSLGLYSGTTGPGVVGASSASGCLTFVFESDFGTTAPGWEATISCVSTPPPPTYVMTTGSITTCSGIFYDSGGSGADYGNSESSTFTICPSTPGDYIEVDFTSFDTEATYDELAIFDGSSSSATFLGIHSGTTGPGVVRASNSSGCLTFVFESDGGVNNAGWEATISCASTPAPASYAMTTASITACSGSFYDSGGSGSNYGNSENSTFTICPVTSGDYVEVDFTSFETFSSSDELEIFDGNSSAATSLGAYSSTTSPGVVTATASNSSGCLTFVFESSVAVVDPGWEATISCVSTPAPASYTMTTGSITTCSGNFYDSGGSGADYGNNENSTFTICPSTPGAFTQVAFTSFETEGFLDELEIFDGNTSGATSLGAFSGTTTPGVVTATSSNSSGCLTFVFESDGSVNYLGWEATISCVGAPTTTNITACSGNFYDSGGASSSYGSNERSTYVVCPSVAGNSTQVDFTSFDIENNYDFMYVYDGNSSSAPFLGTFTGTSGPGLVSATPSNSSGCLTFVFNSDNSTENAGWEATVSCLAPCQNITAALDASTPAADADGIIRTCPGTAVSFTGSATFSVSGAGASYTWDIDGNTYTGTTVSHTFSNSGTYYINLTVEDASGCISTNSINQEVRIATTPVITASASSTSVCTNNTVALTASVTPTPYTATLNAPTTGSTDLDDGSGVSYNSPNVVSGFASSATITSPSDLQDVCLNLEHSFVGDLNITLVCPNGQSTDLLTYPNGGGGLYLGEAIDGTSPGTPVGYDYCFSNTATTLLVDGATATVGTPASAGIVAGTYSPTGDFTDLVGCPVNGTWVIQVTDNLLSDNGNLYNWSLTFGGAASGGFTPSVDTESWQAATDLTNTGTGTADLIPSTAGNYTYTYEVVDNFGCTHTEDVSVSITQGSTEPTLAAPSSICPDTDFTVTASGGTAATGSDIYWYTGPNGSGTALGLGSSFIANTTASTTYYARREGGCNVSPDASITVDVRDFIYGLDGASTSTYCTDDNGWHHFYDGNEIILSVQGDFSGAPAGYPQVSIADNGSFYQQTQGPSTALGCVSGFYPGEERFEMERSWNVDFGGGTPTGNYNVRFYYSPAERLAVETAAATWLATHPTCGYTYKYPSGFFWFKNSSGNYSAPIFEDLGLTGSVASVNGINYVELTGITSFSGGSGGVILTPDPAILDVSLMYFSGYTENRMHNLEWITSSEEDLSHFEVERSRNGLDFEYLGEVVAVGNSTDVQNYSFQDARPFSGMSYYRLKMVDMDGTFEYSDVVSLDLEASEQLYQFYPNPTSDKVYYAYETQQQEALRIEVFDALGQLLHSKELSTQIGANTIAIDLSDYPAGVYLLRVHHAEMGAAHSKQVVKRD